MARMLPPALSPKVTSKAERKVFELFQQLPNSYAVLHSLGVEGHKTKPWAELDFVIVGPDGVYCIEVKGGRVRREEGGWFFTNAKGEENQKAEGPFDQVGGASAALFHFLRTSRLAYKGVMARGVMFPDIRFELLGPDIDQAIVYDQRYANQPIAEYLRRLSAREHARYAPAEPQLAAVRVQQIVDLLRGDFDFRPSLRTRAEEINSELLALTTEQYRAVDMLADNDRVLIEGGAGTGKTVLAAEQARAAAATGASALLCCFSRNLADHLAHVLAGTAVHVESFHRLLARIVREAGLESRLPDATPDYLYEVAFPELCIEAILSGAVSRQYDLLIVDEAQDLMLQQYWDVFDLLVKGGLTQGKVRIFFDPKQNLFDGTDRTVIDRLTKSNFTRCRLSLNCRNTQPTSILSSVLCGASLDLVQKTEGPESILRFYTDAQDQLRLLSRDVVKLLQEGIRPEQITILSPRRLPRSGVAERMVAKQTITDLTEEARVVAGRLSFCTIAGFKGLESDVIMLIDIASLGEVEDRTLLYVAATRPRVLLGVFLPQSTFASFQQQSRCFGERLSFPSPAQGWKERS